MGSHIPSSARLRNREIEKTIIKRSFRIEKFFRKQTYFKKVKEGIEADEWNLRKCFNISKYSVKNIFLSGKITHFGDRNSIGKTVAS